MNREPTNTGAGIDIGSTTVKLVVVRDRAITGTAIAPSSPDPRAAAARMLSSLDHTIAVVATGYGRDLVESIRPARTISEVKAHALGAAALFPGCRATVDIGGQDVKAVTCDSAGRVCRFEMNDRCAAGTGRFLDIMAHRLGFTLETFADAACRGDDTVKISAMCTVFAESEVVTLVSRGCSPDSIARALHRSVSSRIVSMLSRIDAPSPVASTGGGARNAALRALLGEALGAPVLVSEYSQYAGALGCALTALHESTT